MIVRHLDDIRDTDRHVFSKGWDSARVLLRDDGMGFSFHITTLYAGEELRMHYQNHLESVYVLSGEGTIEELDNGKVHELRPGSLYALDAHDRHVLRPRTQMVTACVFNPPVTGREVHDETGAYPAADLVPAGD
ncbi:MAG: ectoine synthase [Sphingomonadales bacterium]